MDLQRWALQANRTMKLEGFVASRSFIQRFKKLNRIVSRKITKIVARGYISDIEQLTGSADDFVQDVQACAMELSNSSNIANADEWLSI